MIYKGFGSRLVRLTGDSDEEVQFVIVKGALDRFRFQRKDSLYRSQILFRIILSKSNLHDIRWNAAKDNFTLLDSPNTMK